ncbi:hypothetical protein [Porphyromonas gingivalis]|uniref:hypothetical protein n=1 Tax=Porphyromonas gingivalis TaxID=837 RepID=UPI0029345EC7|nr:hypothetical protein [Porphyromonas gingivalis]
MTVLCLANHGLLAVGAKIDLSPDNYLVTPKVTVPENGKLSYWVSSQVPWTNEHYGECSCPQPETRLQTLR